MTDQTTEALREAREVEIAQVQGRVDALIEQWPSISVEDGVELGQLYDEAMADINRDVQAGYGTEVIIAACRNTGYRILLDQEITAWPDVDIDLHAKWQTGYPGIGRLALAWIHGVMRNLAGSRLDIMLLTLTKPQMAMDILAAMLDLAAALRDGKAEITIRPLEPDEEA